MPNDFPPIRLGISTCPNDTFAFHGLMNRAVDWRGLDFHVELLDIEELNQRLFRNTLDVAKCSFHTALLFAEQTYVLPSGSALGFGVGPLLLAAEPHGKTRLQAKHHEVVPLALCPGQHTTATLLFRMFYPRHNRIEQVVFSDIMPRLKKHSADFGVCIHEGRFTWQYEGLHCVEDLGTRWEQETGSPLPLGGLVARRSLPRDVLQRVQGIIRDSIEFARSHPMAALPTMRHYAQEMADDVLLQHVELYVNEWTLELGTVGAAALQVLSDRSRNAGIVPRDVRGLEIWGPSSK